MSVNDRDIVNNYDKFYDYLSELFESYSKLAELLSKKLAAISEFDTAALDGIIKEEQVFVLLARGFDSNLHSHREKMGLQGDTLSAVISEMPAERQAGFHDVFVRLRSKLDEVKTLNEKCQALIEDRIYSIEKSLRQLDKSATTPYGKPGSQANPAGGGHMLTKSV